MNLATVKNVIFNWLGMAANILYGFFLVPVVIHGLGDTHYGLWNLIMSCVGYMAVLDFGIQTAVNRYVARFRSLGDTDGVNSVYSNALVMYGIIAIFAFTAGAIVALNIGSIFNIAQGDIGLARNVMLLMALFAAIELPCNVFGAVLFAFHRFDIINVITIVVLCLQALFVWIAMKSGVGLWGFALILFGLGMTKYAIQYIVSHRIAGKLNFRPTLISQNTIRTMIVFSGITFLSIIVNYIIFKTDNIVIGIFLSPEAITFYSIGFMLSDYITQIVTKMCVTFTPMFSEYEARGDQESFWRLLLTSSRFSTLIGIPAGLTAILIAKDFISLWLGERYHTAYTVMVILMISRMAGFPTASMSSMLYGIGRHHINLYTGVFEALLNIVLSVILVRYYGIVGVALGTMIPMVIANIFYPAFVCRNIGLDVKRWVVETFIRPLGMCGLFFVAALLVSIAPLGHTWIVLGSRLAMIGSLFASMFWFVGLRADEREVVLARLRAVRAVG